MKLVTNLFKLAQQSRGTNPNSGFRSLLTKIFSSSKVDETSEAFSLKLHTHTPVQFVTGSSEPRPGSQRRWTINTPRGALHSDYVVHATNGYASHLLPHLAGPSGITPARGQVMASKAAVPRKDLWTNGWQGNEGYEYWFARPCPPTEQPLVILGGGRESTGPGFEYNVSDDSQVNQKASETLRSFLPAAFPKHFENGKEPEMEWVSRLGGIVRIAPL